MGGIHFQTDGEMKAAVNKQLGSQTMEFYTKGIENQITRWKKCVEK